MIGNDSDRRATRVGNCPARRPDPREAGNFVPVNTSVPIPAQKERMSKINRSLIILRPKQRFLDWARSLDDESKDLTLESLNEDSTAYLTPDIWYDSDQEQFLKTCYDILFEEQLGGWWTNEAAWPKERDLDMFLEWFEVEFHSLVFDLCDEPIRVVEDEEDSEYRITGSEH